MKAVDEIEKENKRYDEIPFKPGDRVKVHVKIVEGKRERVQVFEGYVIAIKGSGVSKTFRVRRESYGIGVERVFPLHSPRIEKIEVVWTVRGRGLKEKAVQDAVRLAQENYCSVSASVTCHLATTVHVINEDEE